MSIGLTRSFEKILRSVAEHGPTVFAWAYVTVASMIVLIGWSGVAYARLKGRRTKGVCRMVVSQISLFLMTVFMINFMIYNRLWLSMAGIVVAIVLVPIALKLKAKESEEDARTAENKQDNRGPL